MHSPYEELEYLADYLPDEGETVMITRESGELVCKPWARTDLRDGVDDADLYGRLVQANEQLHGAGALPLWLTLITLIWTGIALHGIIGLDWRQWYIMPALAIPVMYLCFAWIRERQHRLFRSRILPDLNRDLGRRGISPYSLIAGVRQHGELRTLLDELVFWSPRTQDPRR